MHPMSKPVMVAATLLGFQLPFGATGAAHADVSVCGTSVGDFHGTFAGSDETSLTFDGLGGVTNDNGDSGTYTADTSGMTVTFIDGSTFGTHSRSCDNGLLDLTSATSFTGVNENGAPISYDIEG